MSSDAKKQVMIEGSSVLRSEYLYLAKSYRNSDFQSFPLSALVILERDGHERSIQRLNYMDAYKMLIMNGKLQDKKAIYRITQKSMDLIRMVPVFKMHYNSLSDALNLLGTLVI